MLTHRHLSVFPSADAALSDSPRKKKALNQKNWPRVKLHVPWLADTSLVMTLAHSRAFQEFL